MKKHKYKKYRSFSMTKLKSDIRFVFFWVSVYVIIIWLIVGIFG